MNHVIYSEETTVNLYSNYTIIAERAGKYKQEFVETNASTLDSLLQQNGIRDVNWIKIDVDGAEVEVLDGARNTLSESKQITLLIEVHDKAKYSQTMEFPHEYNFEVDFERSYEWGGTHIIARK